jgi:hypothetical protein
MDSNWGEIAENRINQELDFKNIRNRGDFKEAVERLLRNTPDMYGNFRGLNIIHARKKAFDEIIDEMYEDSTAKEKVEKQEQENLEALRKAQLLEAQRTKRSREADERRTHRKTREANKRTVAQWRKGRYKTADIHGVDTKRRMRLSTSNLITRRDIRLRNIICTLDKFSRKHYRSPITGRFVVDPFKRKQ